MDQTSRQHLPNDPCFTHVPCAAVMELIKKIPSCRQLLYQVDADVILEVAQPSDDVVVPAYGTPHVRLHSRSADYHMKSYMSGN
eukprot:SM000168S02592  [mRNA]  locus=s168:17358:18403:+ [translate_table: standard]